MLTRISLFTFSLLFVSFLFSACEQEGCTDPTAMNYFEGATRDNGTCFYEEDFYDPEFERDTPNLPGGPDTGFAGGAGGGQPGQPGGENPGGGG